MVRLGENVSMFKCSGWFEGGQEGVLPPLLAK